MIYSIKSLIEFLRNPKADPLDPAPTVYERSWFDLIVTEFAFLTHHGFTIPPPTGYPDRGMGGGAEFRSTTTTVSVYVDRGDVSVEIGINDPIVIHRQKRSLWSILRAKGIDTAQVYTKHDPAENLDRWQLAEREIVESARAMEAHCGDVLGGDFRIFPAAEEAAKQWYASLNIKLPGQ